MRYRRYRTPTQSRRRRKLGVVLIALALTAVLVTVLLDRAIVPLAEGYAASNAKIYATELINQAVAAVLDEGGVTYDSLVRHTSLNDGTVKSVEADAIDRVKTNVIQKVNELASPGKTLKIPVGTLTNVWFLLGRGPSISIKLQFSPYVTTDLTSKFESAGINQTLHQMMLHVTGEIYI